MKTKVVRSGVLSQANESRRPVRPHRSGKPVVRSVLTFFAVVFPMMAGVLIAHLVCRLKFSFDSSRIVMYLCVPVSFTLLVTVLLGSRVAGDVGNERAMEAFVKSAGGAGRVLFVLPGIGMMLLAGLGLACAFLAYPANQEIASGAIGPYVKAESACVSMAVILAFFILLCHHYIVSRGVHEANCSGQMEDCAVEEGGRLAPVGQLPTAQ
ncbi:hypothetical protein [Neorickettsia findlayensis]|uniref:Uncharacterized protein n=1 Tax=Neorickettsia findlayensis TaxID=2686014 RepID=A0A6P1G8Y3_9RICK|nr:hypothetical protein [Neorickettsia findlayensis]QHD64929.1 hypothetical protein GP480_00355 [Neorickettsia findlayensis]